MLKLKLRPKFFVWLGGKIGLDSLRKSFYEKTSNIEVEIAKLAALSETFEKKSAKQNTKIALLQKQVKELADERLELETKLAMTQKLKEDKQKVRPIQYRRIG
jgi:hypothetical protein